MKKFYSLRELRGLKKKPSTSELIDWIKLLVVGQINAEELSNSDQAKNIPFLGAMIKNEQDMDLIERMS